MADVKRWETGVFPNDVDPMEYVEVVEAKEYDALRAERDAAVADRIEETKETNRLRDACATAADTIKALRARVADLEADAARFRWRVDNLGWRAWHQSPANVFACGLSDEETLRRIREGIDEARLSGNKPPQRIEGE